MDNTHLTSKQLTDALRLSSEHQGEGRYRVSGTDEPEYQISLYQPDEPRCTCAFHSYTEKECKHILHCRLLEGDVSLMRLVASLLSK